MQQACALNSLNVLTARPHLGIPLGCFRRGESILGLKGRKRNVICLNEGAAAESLDLSLDTSAGAIYAGGQKVSPKIIILLRTLPFLLNLFNIKL